MIFRKKCMKFRKFWVVGDAPLIRGMFLPLGRITMKMKCEDPVTELICRGLFPHSPIKHRDGRKSYGKFHFHFLYIYIFIQCLHVS